MKASKLRGIPVVDLDAAEKIGQIVDVVLDPAGRRLAGLMIAGGHGASAGAGILSGAPKADFFPAAGLHAIGPDVVTARRIEGTTPAEVDPLAPFVKLSDLIGRRVVTHSGRVLGPVEDVLLSGADGCILSYPLTRRSAGAAGVLDVLLGRHESGAHAAERHATAIRGDAALRIGPDLIVVPDEGVVESETAAGQQSAPADDEDDIPTAGSEWQPRIPRPAEALGTADPLAREESPTLPAGARGVRSYQQPSS